jgi:KUP system potassium uptake protein
VFGDIGTSPIYTVDDLHPVVVSRDTVFGITSLIFWSVMIIVTLTYVVLVMRADNDGEGGIMALITLVGGGRRAVGAPPPSWPGWASSARRCSSATA